MSRRKVTLGILGVLGAVGVGYLGGSGRVAAQTDGVFGTTAGWRYVYISFMDSNTERLVVPGSGLVHSLLGGDNPVSVSNGPRASGDIIAHLANLPQIQPVVDVGFNQGLYLSTEFGQVRNVTVLYRSYGPG